MKEEIAKYKIEDLSIGQSFSFGRSIREKDVNDFADLSDDCSPLHMEEEFSQSRGFTGRVVHGVLLSSYLSRLVGIHLPGENSVLQFMKLKFLSPAYINDTIKVSGVVEQISMSTNVVVLSVGIENINTHTTLVKGKMQVGFSKVI